MQQQKQVTKHAELSREEETKNNFLFKRLVNNYFPV